MRGKQRKREKKKSVYMGKNGNFSLCVLLVSFGLTEFPRALKLDVLVQFALQILWPSTHLHTISLSLFLSHSHTHISFLSSSRSYFCSVFLLLLLHLCKYRLIFLWSPVNSNAIAISKEQQLKSDFFLLFIELKLQLLTGNPD